MSGAELKKRRNGENMCEHTRYLSEWQEPVWNTLVFLLRQAVRAVDVIGVHLAILDCRTCSESRSQQPEEALGDRVGWVTWKWRDLGGMGRTLEPPGLGPLLPATDLSMLTFSTKKIRVLLELEHTCNLRTQEGEAGGFN